MKYSDYPYERICVEEQNELLNERLERFNNAQSADEQIAVIREMDRTRRQYMHHANFTELNFERDVRNEEAKAEKKYHDSIRADLEEIDDRWKQAVVASPFKEELKKEWGPTFLDKLEMELKTFHPSIKEMRKQEMDLQTEHSELMAGAKIEFEGGTYNLDGMEPFQKDPDRSVRKRAWKAKFAWYEENADAFDDLYDRMVKLRHRIATTLGYGNFAELAYLRMGRIDYGPEEVARYRKQIVDLVVPVVRKLHEQKKKILGLDPLYSYDGIHFKEGNPKPRGTPDEIVAATQEMYREMSPESGEFFDIMVDEELLDLVNREGKMPSGFCTNFPPYKRPYIFCNFNGTDRDVRILIHEAGHAFQFYSSRNQPLLDYMKSTSETNEIHSMAMEVLTWPWMEKFFGGEADRYRYMHAGTSLAFLPWGACGDHFQDWVYENPGATPQERKQQWLELESVYLPTCNYDDLAFPKTGGAWQMIPHFYQCPFYFIDYVIAQTCAFQYWIRNEENPGETWKSYLKLCQAGGSLHFKQLIELAELQSPFEEGCLESIVEKVSAWLDAVDVAKL